MYAHWFDHENSDFTFVQCYTGTFLRFLEFFLSVFRSYNFSNWGKVRSTQLVKGFFDRWIQCFVICVHSENIFSVIANLPALQHNVGSLIKQRPNHQKQRILRLNPNMKKLRKIFYYIIYKAIRSQKCTDQLRVKRYSL